MFIANLFVKLLFVSTGLSTKCFYPEAGSGLDITIPSGRSYYFAELGNDNNEGTIGHPYRSVSKFNGLGLKPGDTVYFRGGDRFKGSLILKSELQGTPGKQIVVTSYGNKKGVIYSANEAAVTINGGRYITLINLQLRGSGRKTGNTKDGVSVINAEHILLDRLNISGFQKSGLLIFASSNIVADHIDAHENGSAGITVEGSQGKRESRDIIIRNSRAENNPGDPTNFSNHSGNGIIAGHCTRLLIDHCTATNNGWDMPRIGNGPVGIWCYESDSVTIQYCLSYRNKTSAGGGDGGGYDFDGGVTNSVIQYCFSYGNQGSGYCLFQYAGASPWYHNIIRYCVSENDGLVSESRAGIFVWNSSGEADQLRDAVMYNNTIYNDRGAVINFSPKSERKAFAFYNNIFVGKDSLIHGNTGKDVFAGNNWLSLLGKSEKGPGLNLDPHFVSPGKTARTTFHPSLFQAYVLPSKSVLRTCGVNIQQQLHLPAANSGPDGKPAPPNGIGACF